MPNHVILLINGWDSSAGGIQTVNRELSSAVAKIYPALSCIVLVPKANQQQIDDAFSRGVRLLSGTRDNDWSNVFLLKELRDIPAKDVLAVVGHSYFTGDQAKDLRDSMFPSALSVQFVHTSPLHIEKLKEYKKDNYVADREVKVQRELSIAQKADLVICIGPRLHRSMHDSLVVQRKFGGLVRAIRCGISRQPSGFRSAPIQPTLLCLGRTESIGVKGLDIFAYAAGYLADSWSRHPSTRELPAPQFVVRGVQGDAEAFERRLNEYAKETDGDPTFIARPYTDIRDDLVADYRGASAFLMPSREEGFGLVACEALSIGVPTLVSENSGIAEVIREAASSHHMNVSDCIIQMHGDSKAIGKRFAEAALEILVHENRAASFCNMLSERLFTLCSWETGAQELINAIIEVSHSVTIAPKNHRQTNTSFVSARDSASAVLDANRSALSKLSGVIGLSIQEAIVVTFETGLIPDDVPKELNGIAIVVRESSPIRQTTSLPSVAGAMLVAGQASGSVSFLRSFGHEILGITAAHVLQSEREDLSVQIGSIKVPARLKSLNIDQDWALLSLPFVEGVEPITRIGPPVLGERVQVLLLERAIQGVIDVVEIALLSVVDSQGETKQYEGLFGIEMRAEVPAGLSGAAVISESGEAIGMIVAGAAAGRDGLHRLFAIPIQSIVHSLNIRLSPSATQMQAAKFAIVPTDELSLQQLIRTLDEVEQLNRRNRRYFTGRLDNKISLVISPVPRAGNIGAATVTTALTLDFEPSNIFVLGLAGGLNPEIQKLADVVISSDVIYYEPGFVDSTGSQVRVRISGATPRSIVRFAQNMSEEHRSSSETGFGIHIGSIASGEKIIRSQVILAEVLRNWSNVVAVDMEGAGVFEAAAAIGPDIGITVVRGIVDFAGTEKVDDVRSLAASNAVRTLSDLIRRLDIDE